MGLTPIIKKNKEFGQAQLRTKPAGLCPIITFPTGRQGLGSVREGPGGSMRVREGPGRVQEGPGMV